jgi:hypothetical protein
LSVDSKATRKRYSGGEHMECKKMLKADQESELRRALDSARFYQAASEGAQALGKSPPKFRCGQSVLQWWSPWFASSPEDPETMKKKQRRSWYSAEIISYDGIKSIHYAGACVDQHTHFVS